MRDHTVVNEKQVVKRSERQCKLIGKLPPIKIQREGYIVLCNGIHGFSDV